MARWEIDITSDRRRVLWLCIVDDVTGAEIVQELGAAPVSAMLRALDRAFREWGGWPDQVRLDNGRALDPVRVAARNRGIELLSPAPSRLVPAGRAERRLRAALTSKGLL